MKLQPIKLQSEDVSGPLRAAGNGGGGILRGISRQVLETAGLSLGKQAGR